MPTKEYKERKLNYIRRYNQAHYRSVNVLFRMEDDEQKAIWDWLHTKYSTAGFLRDLAIAAYRKEKEGK